MWRARTSGGAAKAQGIGADGRMDSRRAQAAEAAGSPREDAARSAPSPAPHAGSGRAVASPPARLRAPLPAPASRSSGIKVHFSID